ncbi:cation-translocating P-type ATPase [Psychromarinibacter sp. S121]|uniref:cation-translocating P-type ATPase n=1 Tax=Psychromarinibacter sp. S121 TaxID=3415127 RepID=UPI003C7D96C6
MASKLPAIATPHAVPPEAVLAELSVSPETGLAPAEVARRLTSHGPNRLLRQKPRSPWAILLHQVRSIIVWLLFAAALFSFIVGDLVEAAAIMVVLALNTGIGFVTEFRAARSMEALLRFAEVQTRVRRDGGARMVDARDLVPGDIVILDAGDMVTADLRLVEASNLQCDESVLTGESVPVDKSPDPVPADAALGDRAGMMFKGTAITRGSGEAVVVATGMATELGRISRLVQDADAEVPPLEKRLEHLGQRLVWLTLVLAAATTAAGILRGHELTEMIQTGIALAVAAIPEGLPVVATLSLARGMWLMAQRNAIVRRLSSVETLGATTLILTDKTGTLTENRMSVVGYLLEGEDMDAALVPSDRVADAARCAVTIGALCTTSELGDGDHVTGDPMEIALLRAARSSGLADSRFGPETEVAQHAFDPDRRMMGSVHADGGGFLVAVKGAPEAVIAVSAQVLGAEGPRALTPGDRAEWTRRNDAAAASGLRCLGLAMKRTESAKAEPYKDLVLVGLVCLEDPLRGDVPPAIAACRDAGIRVVMITGDHAATATRIAQDAKICRDGAETIQGHDLAGFDPATADPATLARVLGADVFARVAPETKLAIVAAHQKDGQIVAMTGDGVNDAPALKKADIGIAMGQRGTQVAHEAAHMILRDDNFATIVEAVRQGRVIFGNIRKFVVYLMSCNLSEVLVVGLAVASGLPAPLLPLQILFLNLVTDVFPAFALGMGRGDGRDMHRPPRNPSEPIAGRVQWRQIAVLGLLLTAFTLGAFGLALYRLGLDPAPAVTVAFLTLALGQLWNVFNVRASDTRLLANDVVRNPYVWGALALCAVLIAAAVGLPRLAEVLQLPFPGAAGVLLALGMSVGHLLAGQVWLRLTR